MRIQDNVKAAKLMHPSKANLLHNLKTGDILQGTVKRLFPNQRAAIQIQGSQLIAQLEASLSVGGKYFFQVTSHEGKMPELKVMTGEQHNGQQMIRHLLQQLGIKENKLSFQLASALVGEQVPMQRSDLMQAMQYIQDNKISQKQAQPILMELMKMRIPVTPASFQAVQAFQNGNFSESLASLERSLLPGQQPMLRASLEHILKGFPSEQSAVRAILSADAQAAKSVLFPLLQSLGFVSKGLDRQAWTNILQQWNSPVTQTPPNQAAASAPFTAGLEEIKEKIQSILATQQQLTAEAKPVLQQGNNTAALMKQSIEAQFPQSFSDKGLGNVRQIIEALSDSKNFPMLERFSNILGTSNERAMRIVLTADAQAEKPVLFPLLQNLGMVSKALDKQSWINALKQWNPPVSQNQGPVTAPFTSSFEGVKEQIQSILGNQKQLMTEAKALQGALMQGNNAAVQPKSTLAAEFPQYFANQSPVTQESGTVRSLLEALAEPKTYQALQRFINIWIASNENTIHDPKEQFLQQMQWVLRDAGLNAENSLKTDDANTMQFKHLLLEMLQSSSGGISRDNAQQVVHFLNGIQLNNMNDSSYFIQANIQIPGQKLGVSKDIDLHFEGKKTADGRIDPEHCRIIFDLNLHGMKETIVDLHVQKKSLSITIYNDQATTPVLVEKLRPNLQEALESMDYHVASVTCKPYTEAEKQQRQAIKTAEERPGSGKVDFRV
ncbi:hypothetical protein [Oceanobacillus oncorhynchi]|uniref:hypothetical protein n=1 Tax=Oceanobacillus oncorhynchi TaxID=545501 RepID=UPI0018670CE1|nr:hypothetical protein [Oceanobacillus oncorhynchi]